MTLPAVTFAYGSADVSYPATPTEMTLPWQNLNHPPQTLAHPAYNLSWGYRFEDGREPNLQEMMLDVDGDGLVDRVVNDPVTDDAGNVVPCRVAAQHRPERVRTHQLRSHAAPHPTADAEVGDHR